MNIYKLIIVTIYQRKGDKLNYSYVTIYQRKGDI